VANRQLLNAPAKRRCTVLLAAQSSPLRGRFFLEHFDGRNRVRIVRALSLVRFAIDFIAGLCRTNDE